MIDRFLASGAVVLAAPAAGRQAVRPPDLVALTDVVVLAGTAVAVGAVLLAALSAVPAPASGRATGTPSALGRTVVTWRWVVRGAAVAAAAAVPGSAGPLPVRVLATASLLALALFPVPGTALAGLVASAVLLSGDRPATHLAQLGGASAWLGAALLLGSVPRGRRRVVLARMRLPLAIVGVGVAAAGLAGGWPLAAEAVVATVLLCGVTRRATAVAAAVSALAGCVWAVLPPAGPPAAGPLLAQVSVGGQDVPVFVTPLRPGWNVVHSIDPLAVGTRRDRVVAMLPAPGARNYWGRLWLPAGRSTLWFVTTGATGLLTVDTGAGPDGPDLSRPDAVECAETSLGAILGGHPAPRTCPADRLSAPDEAAVRGMTRYAAARAPGAIALRADGSARGVEAARVVRDEARLAGVSVVPPDREPRPLLVVSGWDTADATVRDVAAGRIASRGTYLAPWLASSPLLGPSAGQLLPLTFSPRDPDPLRYASVLDGAMPGDAASAGGFLAWRGSTVDNSPPRLFATALVTLPGAPLPVPGASAAPVHEHGVSWLPNGSVVPVSGPLVSG